jgi:hypothetical protein
MDDFKCLPKMKAGGSVDSDDIKQDKKVIKKAFAMHDKQSHEGKKTDLSKLRTGGSVNNAYGSKKTDKDIDNIAASKRQKPEMLCGGGRAMRKGGKAC